MATNKSVRDSMVIVAVCIAVIVTMMLNVIADRKFARVDLTKEGRYSLSQPFKNILSRLEDPATFTYYVSGTVPPGFEAVKRDILDKLKEIETASKGKVTLEPIDPTGNDELIQTLKKEGCELQAQDVKKDQVNVAIVYTALRITYQDKPKVFIPRVTSAEDLEYQIGSQLVELTMKKKPVIAVYAPPAPQQQQQMFGRQQQHGNGYEWLSSSQVPEMKKFDLKAIDMSENNGIPADTSLLILIRPTNFNERQRYEVIKYLAGGGKLLLVTSPFKLSRDFAWHAEKTPSGFEDYLKDAGVSFDENFIADHMNLEMVTSINPMTGEIEYDHIPFFVRVIGENIDQESVLTRFMPGILMPIPSEIKADVAAARKAGLNLSVLAKTSKQSWHVPFSPSFDPEKERLYDPNTKVFDGPKDVFVMVDGQFPFPYEGKAVPEWKADDPTKPPAPTAKDKKPETATVAKKPGSIAIFSCPDAFHAMYLGDRRLGREFQQNIYLLLNMMEKYSMGDDLLQIRTKTYETRSIDRLAGKENESKRGWIRHGMTFGGALVVMLLSIVWFFFRKSEQERYERRFSQTSGPSSFTA